MKTVGEIVQFKGRQIWSIEPDKPVYDAIKMMADKNIGALLIIQDDQMFGIVSERDYARKVILKGKSSRKTSCREIMTDSVVSVSKDYSVNECMQLFTQKHIRHLPVVDAGKVIGMVSIGDIVKTIITDQENTIEQLQRYITGTGQIS